MVVAERRSFLLITSRSFIFEVPLRMEEKKQAIVLGWGPCLCLCGACVLVCYYVLQNTNATPNLNISGSKVVAYHNKLSNDLVDQNIHL